MDNFLQFTKSEYINDVGAFQVADLQHELREPDVRISMREKTKDKSGKVGILGKDIDVEKVRPEYIKEISTEVKRVRIIHGRPVVTKTICNVRCHKAAIYFWQRESLHP